MIQNATKWMNAIVWQTMTEDPGIPEPPLVISQYSDVIEISQEGKAILVNPETIPELVKVLKAAMKEKEKT